MRVTDEDEYFPPPRELRDLITAVDVVATFMLGASTAGRPALNDRTVSASNVLAGLAAQPRPEPDD